MYEEKSDVPQRETEISRVLANLNLVVSSLEEGVAGFEARLEGVVRGGVSGGKIGVGSLAPKAVEPEFNTKLAQEIDTKVHKINYLNERLNDLRNRIEL